MKVNDTTFSGVAKLLAKGHEGIVFRGCGGEIMEHVNGYNDILTQEGIIKQPLTRWWKFENNGLTNLLVLLPRARKGVDMARLAAWRIRAYHAFNCSWLSDYVPNERETARRELDRHY